MALGRLHKRASSEALASLMHVSTRSSPCFSRVCFWSFASPRSSLSSSPLLISLNLAMNFYTHLTRSKCLHGELLRHPSTALRSTQRRFSRARVWAAPARKPFADPKVGPGRSQAATQTSYPNSPRWWSGRWCAFHQSSELQSSSAILARFLA